jgi:hypothetical protein
MPFADGSPACPRTARSPRRQPARRAVLAAFATALAAPAPSVLAGPALPVAAGAGPGAPAAVLSRIEFVAASRPPARRPDGGLLVLDLDGLESADAALQLALGWRRRHGTAGVLICWLQAARRKDLHDALGALTQTEAPPCTRILVPG